MLPVSEVSAPLRVLVACEYSGVVRDAFRALGHDAVSCDLLDTEVPGPHVVGDVRSVLGDGWDIIIAHPPCTRLCLSGVRWLHSPPAGRDLDSIWRELDEAAALFADIWNAPCARVAIENPTMHGAGRSAIERRTGPLPRPFVVHPWQHGHGETKRTCLFARGLPPIVPTEVVDGREARIWKLPRTPDRWRERSRTYRGIAAAMAAQWGGRVVDAAK